MSKNSDTNFYLVLEFFVIVYKINKNLHKKWAR